MERYRLKNIMILILALLNMFLLSSLLYRQSQDHALRRRSEEELVALFAASDITLARSAISWAAPPAGITMTRSALREQELAKFLLGSSFRESSQGGISSYRGAAGSLQFRSSGRFDAGLLKSSQNGEDLCRELCKAFSYSEPVFSLDESGTGTAGAVYQYEKLPVHNCTLTFTLHENRLTAISGTLLPGTGIPTEEEDLLSCAAALTAFQQMRREEGTVGSSILGTHLAYELESTPSAPMALSAAWCIETDIASYYVNCSTGAITLG